ncbi:MAG: 6-phosphofructokinase [Sedimentisphaerales bacterium]|nr:6-phosphofructokinase [Sedimentisphaerales bacterium]
MTSESKTSCIGILTSGGDCPGLNAAIRAVTKAAINEYNMTVIGILDGFRGLVENRTIHLEAKKVSGILTTGGTILGTSRDKVHKMLMGGKIRDMTEVAVENVHRNHIDCLVCLGGGGTQKNALRLHQVGGINVMTLPKTIDNDVEGTDTTFGFDTALQIATDAIDRLHTTATSHHRVIVCEIMGHKTGWLTLSAGIAGGADAILIPEIPYDLNVVADYLLERRRRGSRFSIIAVAEGAVSVEDAKGQEEQSAGERLTAEESSKNLKKKKKAKSVNDPASVSSAWGRLTADDTEDNHLVVEPISSRIARRLQEITGIDARVTSLGHVQRGGIPTAFDRWLCTRLGTKAAQLLAQGVYNVMVGYDSGLCKPIPLEQVAGKRKIVPNDHPMIVSARLVGTCMGDKSPFDS